MVDGDCDAHVLVVERARATEDDLDEADKCQIEEETEEQGDEEGPKEGGECGGEIDGEGEWEEEAEVRGQLEQ